MNLLIRIVDSDPDPMWKQKETCKNHDNQFFSVTVGPKSGGWGGRIIIMVRNTLDFCKALNDKNNSLLHDCVMFACQKYYLILE